MQIQSTRVLKNIGWDDPSRLEDLLPKIDPHVARALERALEGAELSFEEGLRLACAKEAEIEALVLAADRVRRDRVGDRITYVVNRNINFTNICFIGCRFCAFSRAPRESDAYFHSFEEIARRSEEAWELGAREVCVQGGLPRGLDAYYYRDILRVIKAATPGMHIHAFSPMEIVYGVELTGMVLRDYLTMLKEAGLGTLPGTAAEILDDDVRNQIERVKLKVPQWIEVIKTAHRIGVRTTSTMMYGHTETEEHWVRHLLLLRDIQKETGGFTEFVPLGFVHEHTQLFKSGDARPGPTVEEHLKVHALSRLMLSGWIDNIQVSWVKMSREVTQACLRAGANDYGGTLMNENISRLAGSTSGEYMSPEQFRERIRELGREPAERDTLYRIVGNGGPGSGGIL
ncbi:MAG TPA: 5-amino-6-(D-ribitylamino)uracil--L-tyrosine 4-hydroxyphenyl transferase CofH [Blastocatellia bacterium]|jgi:FO synthase|nr:5-amino-6-(D-ribitylamino)uracil--L-tyrosine 4-hydroxyphenyl transferase CofH [Blastocatellia bacterium]